MLIWAIVLLIIGLGLLVVDVYIEGFGVLGVVALVIIAASLFMTALSGPFGAFFVLGKVVLLIPGAYFFFRFLKNRQLDGRFILTETLAEDKIDVSGLEYFIGKEGITKTALRPHGTADFNGAGVEVRSDSKYIPEGKRVKVVDVKGKNVFVTLIEN
jgi:membrane-bound serine protease (ClpP class)